MRDAAQVVQLAVERDGIDHRAYNVGAADVCAEVPSLELVRAYYPDLPELRQAERLTRNRSRRSTASTGSPASWVTRPSRGGASWRPRRASRRRRAYLPIPRRIRIIDHRRGSCLGV